MRSDSRRGGVTVIHDPRGNMVHGYLTYAGLGGGFRAPVFEAVDALRDAIGS